MINLNIIFLPFGQENFSAPPAPLPSPLGDCVAIKEASRHSRKSGNPVFNSIQLFETWMPAFAGMTNYDTVSRTGERARGEGFFHSFLFCKEGLGGFLQERPAL